MREGITIIMWLHHIGQTFWCPTYSANGYKRTKIEEPPGNAEGGWGHVPVY